MEYSSGSMQSTHRHNEQIKHTHIMIQSGQIGPLLFLKLKILVMCHQHIYDVADDDVDKRATNPEEAAVDTT